MTQQFSSALSLSQVTQRAFYSTFSRGTMPIMLGALGVSIAIIMVLWWLSSWLIGSILLDYIEWDWLITLMQGAAALGLVWGIFPLLIPLFISFFVNQLSAIIESREYPESPQGSDMPFWPEFAMDLRFSFYAIGLNLLILPFYLIPGINLIIYYALNAHLLGKQYMMMVSRRHIADQPLQDLLEAEKTKRYIYGLIIVFFSTIPVLNLIAPIFATALMVHAYQQLAVKSSL